MSNRAQSLPVTGATRRTLPAVSRRGTAATAGIEPTFAPAWPARRQADGYTGALTQRRKDAEVAKIL